VQETSRHCHDVTLHKIEQPDGVQRGRTCSTLSTTLTLSAAMGGGWDDWCEAQSRAGFWGSFQFRKSAIALETTVLQHSTHEHFAFLPTKNARWNMSVRVTCAGTRDHGSTSRSDVLDADRRSCGRDCALRVSLSPACARREAGTRTPPCASGAASSCSAHSARALSLVCKGLGVDLADGGLPVLRGGEGDVGEAVAAVEAHDGRVALVLVALQRLRLRIERAVRSAR
jgi:hypothetical protein